MKTYITVLLTTLLLAGTGLIAQKAPLSFSRYSSRQGLSSNTVYDIMQDSFGFIWLATENGLNRFDGTNFKVYRHDPGNPNGLLVNHITSVYESKDGVIWIGTTGGGLCYYDRHKDSVISYKPKGPIYISTAINSVNGDDNNKIWITSYGALNIIDTKTKEVISSPKHEKLLAAVASKISLCFLQDSKKRAWVGTTSGLYMFNVSTNNLQLYKHQAGQQNSLPGEVVTRIAEDKNGTIWVGTENGLGMLLPDGSGFRSYRSSEPVYKISNNTITSLAVDEKNRLWIGTEQGLDILDAAANLLVNAMPDKRDPGSISTRSIRSVFIDKSGICWIGTFRGGLNKYDRNASNFNLKNYSAFDAKGLRAPLVTSFARYQNDVFVGTDGGGLQVFHRSTGLMDYINLPFSYKNGDQDLSVLAMESSGNGEIWVGTFSNGIYKYNAVSKTQVHYVKGSNANDLNHNDIFCLKEDSEGNTWVGTNGGGVNVVKADGSEVIKYVNSPSSPDDPARPSSNFIRCIEEDREGRMWIGTFGSGISVLDPATQKFTNYHKWNSGLPSDYVLAIKEDSRGNIWTGSEGNGVGLLRKGSDHFELLSEKDGLPDASINQILEDAAGKIWIGTNNGLSCYDPKTGRFKNYSHNDGLQAGAFMPNAAIRLPDGELFFGGQNGFNHFNPADLKTNKNLPQVTFTSLKVDNLQVIAEPNGIIDRSIVMAEQINLKYKQAFTLGFEALSFTVPEANQYQYKLEGFDAEWVSAGKEHSAYYANIPPGDYTFKVRASNNDGLWNPQEKQIKISVAPPWFRTAYAYLLYFLIAGSILLYVRRVSIQKIQARFALQQERQAANQLIERQRSEAAHLHKLDQLKIKFLTNLSHEFRTPISLILGPVENLIAHTKESEALNQLNLIKRNSKRLLNLVNQLLDFRKMEEQELKLQLNEGDIVQFLKDICDSFKDLALQKNISFGFYCDVPGLFVSFDHNKMERILFNLLSNAFKFTYENGNISVTLSEKENIPDNGFTNVTIAVKDSGIGIPKEALPHIFESFFQHDTTADILNHGTGIGLAITKEFVQIHGGNIEVESEEGQGSNFHFTLPLQLAAENQQLLPQPVNDLANGKAQKTGTAIAAEEMPSVLIVEDDNDFRYYIKENLKSNYRIFEAPNGKEGWQRTLFHHPDIVVCDIQMPVMNGLELVQKLKSDKRTRHIPTILLTAANTPGGLLDGLETGAIDYMTKPFDFAVLQAKIHNILLLNQSFKDTYTRQVTVNLPETKIVSAKDKFLQKALSYIHDNLNKPELSVEQLSKHLYISRASLYNRVLEYTGMTPLEFIRSVKLARGKELLEKTDLTVSEIAYELGFANGNYFTKVFKAKYNMTPSEFQANKEETQT